MSNPLIPAAVIYCPALNEHEPSKVIDDVAKRLARTLDHHSVPIATKYTVRLAASEDYGNGGRTEVREILRLDPGKNPETEAVVTHRVYGLNYLELLDDHTAEANVLLKTWKLLCLYFTMSWRFVAACRASSFTRRQKLSVAVGGFMLMLVLAYAVLTVGTLVHLAVDAWEGVPADQTSAKTADPAKVKSIRMPEPEPGSLAKGWQAVVEIMRPAGEWIGARIFDVWEACTGIWAAFTRIWDFFGSPPAKLIAVGGAFGLSVTGLRSWLDGNVVLSLRFCRYLELGLVRAACAGRFNALLEHVLSGAPSRTDVVAYSFGSLVALDALYPAKGDPGDPAKADPAVPAEVNPDPRIAHVSSLTTIGCPFDFVRTFWDKYFEHRTTESAHLLWLNVYTPVDLLGSNFANDDGVKPKRGINASSRDNSKKLQKAKAAPKSDAVPNPGTDSNSNAAPNPEADLNAEAAKGARPEENLFYDPMGRRELKLIDALSMAGFTAHAQYWVPDDFDAESCFRCFVPKLYPTS